jgi:hypothetical protein
MLHKICVLILSLSLFLIGCSSSTPTSASKPQDVQQDIWDNGLSLFKEIDQTIQSGNLLTDQQDQKVRLFLNKYYDKVATLSQKERDIVLGLHDILQSGVAMKLYKAKGDFKKYDEVLKGYNNQSDNMKKIYGIK